MTTRSLPELVKELPPDAQEVVRNLVELLLSRSKTGPDPKAQQPLRQDWAGALRAYRGQYTALELQHRANEIPPPPLPAPAGPYFRAPAWYNGS